MERRQSTSRFDTTSSLFSRSSLFNHSCLPSARWSTLGDVMVIRARVDIPAGQEDFPTVPFSSTTILANKLSRESVKSSATVQDASMIGKQHPPSSLVAKSSSMSSSPPSRRRQTRSTREIRSRQNSSQGSYHGSLQVWR